MKKLRSRPLPHYLDQAVSAPVLPNQVREVFEQIPDPSCSALNSPACGAILDRDVNATMNILRMGHHTLALK